MSKLKKIVLSPLILALDVDSFKDAVSWVKFLSDFVSIFKVGPRLLLHSPEIISEIHRMKKKVFLDLKLHDIPSSVAGAVRQAGLSDIYALTVHASGGIDMLQAAQKSHPRPKLWGVTFLTSMDEENLKKIGMRESPLRHVDRLASLSSQARLDGIVCSVHEATRMRKKFGRSFTLVTPGINLEKSSKDQKRTARPREAAKAGSHFIVVGRAILSARDPERVAQNILEEFREHTQSR